MKDADKIKQIDMLGTFKAMKEIESLADQYCDNRKWLKKGSLERAVAHATYCAAFNQALGFRPLEKPTEPAIVEDGNVIKLNMR
jgi:hypothetical protein